MGFQILLRGRHVECPNLVAAQNSMKPSNTSIIALFAGFLLVSSQAFPADARLSLTNPTESRVEIHLENDRPVAALQFTMNATGAVNFRSVSLVGRMNNGSWVLSSFKLNDSTINVVVIRKDRGDLYPGTGPIAEALFYQSDGSVVHAVSFSRVVVSCANAIGLDVDLDSIEWACSAPQPFTLNQNYPNPFNPNTSIPFTLSQPANVDIIVYDVAGRQIKKIRQGFLDSGEHVATWNSSDESGALVPSGIYFVRLRVGEQYQVRKMILTR